jgi:predicted transcriptional regulator
MPRERDEQGRITESYPLDDVRAALERLGPAGAGTQEVADELGCAYATAYEKLRELEDQGRVSSRKVANARLWIPEDDPDD